VTTLIQNNKIDVKKFAQTKTPPGLGGVFVLHSLGIGQQV
jgi:hypothetical protein